MVDGAWAEHTSFRCRLSLMRERPAFKYDTGNLSCVLGAWGYNVGL
jgi:hypothetical protein